MTTRGRYLDIRGLRIHVREAGSGPLVVLLHGFPEFSYQWRHHLPALASQGLRVVAPDQRGYGLSDKPRRRRSYGVEELAADVAALIEACGERDATVVGHDWGGLVGYYTAMLHPERVSRLVIMNAPHPAHFERVVRRNPRQVRRSWYVIFFMLPWLPEAVMRAGRWYAFRRSFERLAASAFTADDIARYVDAWSQPGAAKAMVDWYRAVAYRRPASVRALWKPIRARTLILWGDRDRHLLPVLAEPPREWVPNVETVRFPNASHWLPHEEPAETMERIAKIAS